MALVQHHSLTDDSKQNPNIRPDRTRAKSSPRQVANLAWLLLFARLGVLLFRLDLKQALP